MKNLTGLFLMVSVAMGFALSAGDVNESARRAYNRGQATENAQYEHRHSPHRTYGQHGVTTKMHEPRQGHERASHYDGEERDSAYNGEYEPVAGEHDDYYDHHHHTHGATGEWVRESRAFPWNW